MLKHFAAATLGFAVLFGAIGPAAADKGGHYLINKYDSPHVYPYTGQSTKYVARTAKSQSLRRPNIKLDFETEAVWRNLRPEWFH
jgi:hypothetical protein